MCECYLYFQKTPKKKKDVKKKKDEWQTMSEMLQSLLMGDLDKDLHSDQRSKLVSAAELVFPQDAISTTKEILLNFKTLTHTRLKGVKLDVPTKLYFEILSKLIQSVQTSEDEAETDQSLDVPSDEFSSLHVAGESKQKILVQVFKLILMHPNIRKWFLWQNDTNMKGTAMKYATKLSQEVTEGLSSLIKGNVCKDTVDDIDVLLSWYKERIQETLKEALQQEMPENSPVLTATLGFLHCMRDEDKVAVCNSLMSMDLLITEGQDPVVLSHYGKTLVNVMEDLLHDTSVASTQSLPFAHSCVQKLVLLATQHHIADLDSILLELLNTYPVYVVATHKQFLHRCLEIATETRLALATQMVAMSAASRIWMRDWCMKSDKLTKTSHKMKYLGTVATYLNSLDTSDQDIKDWLENIYFSDLTEWVLSDEIADDSHAEQKMKMLITLTSLMTPGIKNYFLTFNDIDKCFI